ncbi:Predicted protein [Saccharicrinis carchari]|uniref:Phosphodiester glycosidase domain-containing protein n=1 Tax=Saccharicrinis carchari TaxID=1168039 RepID=A0A521F6G7_SACCC|nr:phosphodiester glycosidase family protein [Saccharicrinis carchari]SMO91737.1 Predicted protein [Saccharicrinis carchari]
MKYPFYTTLSSLLILLSVFVLSCSDEEKKEIEDAIAYETQILGLSFENVEMELPVRIDHEAQSITAYVLGSVDVGSLIPRFSLSADAKVSPKDGVKYSFATPVTFQVSAPDQSYTNYVLTVVPINNEINTFALQTGQQAWEFNLREGTITEVSPRKYEVEVYVHHDDDITNLNTIVDAVNGAVVSPDPTTVKDYSSPVEYSVSDGNGNQRIYTVKVNQTDQQKRTWTKTSTYDNVDGISMYTSTTPFRFNQDGTAMPFSAYAIKIDITKNFEFVPYYNKDKGNMKVSEMVADYKSTKGKLPLVGINTGYFASTSSYSLVINNGKLLSSNISQLTRKGSFYVTRGAFGHDQTSNYSVDWVYTVAEETVYGYPQPALNVDGETPQPKPSPSFPENGSPYNKVNAIGGGPVLIRDGSVVQNYGYELFYDDIIRSLANRTAIGITADKELVILVVDGRAAYSSGISLKDMARLLKEDMDCKDALNLDGGGSSTLIVNGNVYNQNSIDSGQRSVLTGLLIVKD